MSWNGGDDSRTLARIADALEAIEGHLRGMASQTPEDRSGSTPEKGVTLAPVAGITPILAPVPPARGPNVGEAVTQFVAQKRAEGLADTSVVAMESVLEHFRQWAGPAGFAQLSRPDVARWRDAVHKGADARGNGKASEPRSIATVNRWLTTLGTFLRWAHAMGYRDGDDLIDGLKLRGGKRAAEARSAFTEEQMARVLGPEFWKATCKRPPAHRWLPLLMAFTGARPEEIAQLRVGDVWRVEGGGLALDLATLDDGQRRKSEAARRMVPIPRRLQGLFLDGPFGPMQWVVPARAALPLFDLKPTQGRLSYAPSRWFNDTWLRKRCGLTDKRLVLYSLRHTVATTLKRKGVQEALIAELLGHSNPSITTGRYGKAYEVEQLAEAVDLLPWWLPEGN